MHEQGGSVMGHSTTGQHLFTVDSARLAGYNAGEAAMGDGGEYMLSGGRRNGFSEGLALLSETSGARSEFFINTAGVRVIG